MEEIKQLMEGEVDRLSLLSHQEKLLLSRKERLENIIQILRKSRNSIEKGEQMDVKEMFKGFESEDEWKEALHEQNEYLQETYDVDILHDTQIDVTEMNEQAAEAIAFMKGMQDALTSHVKHHDEYVRQLIRNHLAFLNEHGHQISPADFVAQARFFLQDDFHLQMLENQQTGLAYYLFSAAEAFAAEENQSLRV